MTKEERYEKLMAAPEELRSFILSEALANESIALYDTLNLAPDVRAGISALIVDLLLGDKKEPSLDGALAALLKNDNEKISKVKMFIDKSIAHRAASTSPINSTSTPSREAEQGSDWYEREKAEILREIEGPHAPAMAIGFAQASTVAPLPKPSSIPKGPEFTIEKPPVNRLNVPPTPLQQSFANQASAQIKNTDASTAKTGVISTATGDVAAILQQKTQSAFTLPPSATKITVPPPPANLNTKPVPPLVPQNSNDPYREPPTA